MVLTLYGDMRFRNEETWVGTLLQLLGNFGLSEQAIRSALSRMCRKDLLRARHIGKRSYYSLTPRGATLLAKGARRIFERREEPWDGMWHLVIYSIPEQQREIRDRFRQELGWMGYGPLGNATWISPHDLSGEVRELAQSLGVSQYVEVFSAHHRGFTSPEALVARCWELERIHQGYHHFLDTYTPRFEESRARLQRGEALAPAECFVERFLLSHEYRRLPFFDPDLPLELLPRGWLRPQAAGLFLNYHSLLSPKANQYFDSVFVKAEGKAAPVAAAASS